MALRRYLAAAVQINAGSDKRHNLQRVAGFVEQAARAGAALVALPEVFFWRGDPRLEAEMAEPIPGPTTEVLSSLAREFSLHIVAGSILERNGDSRPFNTSVVLDARGQIVTIYRKIHLFDVRIPGRVEILESQRRSAGDSVVSAKTELGTIGLAICYDLRFPELFRTLVQQGAEVVCLPSAFTFVTGAAHWEPLLRARAIENQVYLIAPNQIGTGEHGVQNFGHSAIVDPWGTVVAQAREDECVILAEIDRDYIARVRTELPCLQHVRLKVTGLGDAAEDGE